MISHTPGKEEQNPGYERYRPEMYSRKTPIFWWVRKRSYVRFIVRELTSLGVLAYVIILMLQLRAVSRSAEAYQSMMDWLASPGTIVLHILILGVVLFHSITWFNLAPSALALKFGKRSVPGKAIIAANIVLWIVLSAALTWIILSI